MKPLEALKRIKSHYNDRVCIDILEDFDLIENALKEKEEQDSVIKTLENTITLGYTPPKISIDNDKMDFSCGSIGLEISETLNKAKIDLIRNWILRTCFPKELKAFEIIKNKKVDISLLLDSYTLAEYNSYLVNELTEEEYEILKGVLK